MKTPKMKRKNAVQRHVQEQRLATNPMSVPRTHRVQNLGANTSGRAGQMIPLRVFPLLREDALRRGACSVTVTMKETVEVLKNAVNCNFEVWLVPNLASDRFDSMHDLDLAYAKEPKKDGDPVVPYFSTRVRAAYGSEPIIEKLHLPCVPGQTINDYAVEAYNIIWNHKATNRSQKLEPRTSDDNSIAPAFWDHDQYRHIKATWEAAYKAGQIALDIAESKLHVKGILKENQSYPLGATSGYESGEDGLTTGIASSAFIHSENWYISEDPDNPGHPNLYTQLNADSVTVSLENIEMVRTAARFAEVRERYSGHSDDWLIDMLMNGLSVPEQELKHPIRLHSQRTIVGMMKRHATDGDNLTQGVVDGATRVNLSFATPKIPCGGTIVIMAECVPDQLFERREDPMTNTIDPADLPEFQRDFLDTQKVDIVQRKQIDCDHDTGEELFGYAPKNSRWNDDSVRIGGKFIQHEVDAPFNENRNHIWASEVQNPVYGPDFILADGVHQEPFVFDDQDVFEFDVVGMALIEGLTQFGDALIETTENYAKVIENVPDEITPVDATA